MIQVEGQRLRLGFGIKLTFQSQHDSSRRRALKRERLRKTSFNLSMIQVEVANYGFEKQNGQSFNLSMIQVEEK